MQAALAFLKKLSVLLLLNTLAPTRSKQLILLNLYQ